ncbi:unnamed protein product [Ophioblennius macclurei]
MKRGTERLFQPPLRDHEAAVLENAVRLAVDSVLNVLYSVNGARSREYRRMVEERDREIRRLEGRLAGLELELRLLRRQGCSCGLYVANGAEERPGGGGDPEGASDPEGGEPACGNPACGDPDSAGGQQDCEMRISLGLFGSPPSLVSPHSLGSTLPSSPGRLVLDQSSDASRGADICGSVVKEEACDLDAVLIKWEMSEERAAGGQRDEDARSPSLSSGGKKTLESSQTRKCREKPQAEPGGALISEGEHLRNRKRSVPMSQLPEEAQRIKRAAWRAASRRYYARKVARQQAGPAQPRVFPRLMNCPFSQSGPLPQDSWASGHRRFYSQEAPYGLLIEGADPPGDAPDKGGIMCS